MRGEKWREGKAGSNSILDVAPPLSPISPERHSPAYCHLEDTPPPAKKRTPEVVRCWKKCNPEKREAEKGTEKEEERHKTAANLIYMVQHVSTAVTVGLSMIVLESIVQKMLMTV